MTPDAFDRLGLPPRFALERAVLEARHRELSRVLHPDRHQSAGTAERRRALSEAIDVNHAVRHLKDPASRAELLIARATHRSGAAHDAVDVPDAVDRHELASVAPSPEFLMEILELREELAATKARRDLVGARKLGELVQERERSTLSALEGLLDSGPIGQLLGASSPARAPSIPSEIVVARRRVAELRYLQRFLEELGSIEDELD